MESLPTGTLLKNATLFSVFIRKPFLQRKQWVKKEIKIHVYRKRQTSDSSWQFLRVENQLIKTVPNDSCGSNWRKTTYSCVEAIKSKRKIREKLGHVVQIHVCRLA